MCWVESVFLSSLSGVLCFIVLWYLLWCVYLVSCVVVCGILSGVVWVIEWDVCSCGVCVVSLALVCVVMYIEGS